MFLATKANESNAKETKNLPLNIEVWQRLCVNESSKDETVFRTHYWFRNEPTTAAVVFTELLFEYFIGGGFISESKNENERKNNE